MFKALKKYKVVSAKSMAQISGRKGTTLRSIMAQNDLYHESAIAAETRRMMKSMAELPQRNAIPVRAQRPPTVQATLSSATSDIDSLRSHEVRAVSTDLRARIIEQEEVIGAASKQEGELIAEVESLEEEVRAAVEEAERYHMLYREEMKRRVENKTLIEVQKKDINRNFFITAELSRPNSRPGTRGTVKTSGAQRRVDSAYGARRPGSPSLFTKIVSFTQNPATLGAKRVGVGPL